MTSCSDSKLQLYKCIGSVCMTSIRSLGLSSNETMRVSWLVLWWGLFLSLNVFYY